ncbi:MAG: helix-turn-helix domain-containing protein [Woeseiaceae bacterium]
MQATEFVESYMDAWNHHDPKGVADHLTADGIYLDVPQNTRRSHDELITSLAEFFSESQQKYELLGQILANEDTIAFQYRICQPGNNYGSYDDAPLCGAEFITLHGDAAMTITDYYDVPNLQSHKYAKSGLSDEQMRAYKAKLGQIMQVQQMFLQPELTLPKLAKEVDCSVNHLSQVINAGFGMSFFDFLNKYRIDHARKLLTTLDGRTNAILNIAFTVGFNSNSAFYAAFKKCVGQTPAQYRREQMPKSH